ncbi:MAG: hypothetical protein MI745_01430 [Pseudomonadales bacterium]|nr:hypothetical protein [Pseudomonadales bacterium]
MSGKNDPQNLHCNHWNDLRASQPLTRRLHDETDSWLITFREQYGELPALDAIQSITVRDWI